MNKTLLTTGAKTWGQRTDDGKYVIVHNHAPTRANRFPVTALVGTDGHLFDTMLCLNGDVSPRRYRGQWKETGMNYFRGFTEGNGNPPGDDLWVAYSMNKEDIWVSRAHLPLTGVETSPLHENFETADSLDRWNLHLPQWAPTQIVAEPGTKNQVMELRDEEPYDYALAERIFPSSRKVHIEFRAQVRQITTGGTLEIEVQSQHHDRSLRLRFDDGYLSADFGKTAGPQARIERQRWYAVSLDLDCDKQSFTLSVDGKVLRADVPFTEKLEAAERIVFRTGVWRGLVPPGIVAHGGEKPGGFDDEDLPASGEKVAPCVFWIDDLVTKSP
jgi:hypothetical protein